MHSLPAMKQSGMPGARGEPSMRVISSSSQSGMPGARDEPSVRGSHQFKLTADIRVCTWFSRRGQTYSKVHLLLLVPDIVPPSSALCSPHHPLHSVPAIVYALSLGHFFASASLTIPLLCLECQSTQLLS